MKARLLPFEFADYTFTDVTGTDRHAEATKHFIEFSVSAVYAMRSSLDPNFCSLDTYPDLENTSLCLWVETEAGRFFGTFLLYKLRTLEETRDKWTISSYGMAAFKMNVKGRNFWRLTGALMQFLLEEDMEMDDGRVLDIVRWDFPEPRKGDSTEHIWGDEETLGARDFFVHTTSGRSIDTGQGRMRDHLVTATKEEIVTDGPR